MGSDLSLYRKKRDFSATPEPQGGKRRARAPLRFVVQKHAASRLHYDFRLELEGTLKSWAVPKGPSLDPSEKRMAVQVEDHPLDYIFFEGTIPQGQYGAGSVIVWDTGTWQAVGDARAGYKEGKLKFELFGEKLTGRFMLVRMHGHDKERQAPWLLIKEKDESARPAADYSVTEAAPNSVLSDAGIQTAARVKKATAKKTTAPTLASTQTLPKGVGDAPKVDLPVAFAPQLATLIDAPPRRGPWSYEIKFDGYRLLARIDNNDVHLFTRNGHDWTSKLAALAADLKALNLPCAWLDGEIVIANAAGRSDFQALQNAFDSNRVNARDVIQYYLFDMPFYGGRDLRQLPTVTRRAALCEVLANVSSDRIRFSADFGEEPQALLDAACKMGLEGIIGKRVDAPYVSARSKSWIKLKCQKRQEFVIGGYTDPKGSRAGLGALLLGVYDDRGQLRYAGNVGTGFTEATLAILRTRLDPLATDKAPFFDPPSARGVHWVKPRLVGEVSFAQWTGENRLRHAVFHGLRSDKLPRTILREKAVLEPEKQEAAGVTGKRSTVRTKKSAAKKTGSSKQTVSHAERIIDPSTGFTKGELVAYYQKVAPILLAHLIDRPVSLVRAPQGIDKPLFFQKHGDTLRIPGVIQLAQALWPAHPPLIAIADVEGVFGAAQMNAVELHTWNARVDAIEKPDRLIFDLDPGEGVPFAKVRQAAALSVGLLEELGLTAFLKTSGGKGLHIVMPIARRYSWDGAKDFSQAVVKQLARTLPELFVAKSGPKNRVGKIFVDYLRNARGATTACAFSARARPGLGVSMTIAREQLDEIESGNQWDIVTALAYLSKRKKDPWADYAKTANRLEAAAKRLGHTLT